MRFEDALDRKAYVKSVRESFELTGTGGHSEGKTIDKGEAKDGFSFFKVRMLLAACIFAAFVICDQTHTKFYQYSTQDVVKQITKNYDYDKIRLLFRRRLDTALSSYAPWC